MPAIFSRVVEIKQAKSFKSAITKVMADCVNSGFVISK